MVRTLGRRGVRLTVGLSIVVVAVVAVVAVPGCGGSSGGTFTWLAAGTWYLEAIRYEGGAWHTQAEDAVGVPVGDLIHYTKVWIGPNGRAQGEVGTKDQQPGSETVYNGSWTGTGAQRNVVINGHQFTAEVVNGRLVLVGQERLIDLRFIRVVLYWPFDMDYYR